MQEIIVGGIRLAGLSLRMILTLFMARFLTFSDVGIFSLLVGTVALLPGTIGIGLGYFVNREIVSHNIEKARIVTRDRLAISLVCAIVSVAAIWMVAIFIDLDTGVDMRIFSVIIILEVIGFDLNFILISRDKNNMANLLYFARTSIWIPFYIGYCLISPSARNIDTLVMFWLGGELAFVLMFFALTPRRLFKKDILTHPFDFSAVKSRYPAALTIWGSDLSLAIGQNIDRFIISHIIGVEAAGVYYFFFSIASGAYQVVLSATVQPYMPRIRAFVADQDVAGLVRSVNSALMRVIAFSVPVFVAAGIGSLILVYLLGRIELIHSLILVPIILSGMLAKIINELFAMVDYAMEKDLKFVGFSVVLLVLTACGLTVLTWMGGLAGAASALVLTMGSCAYVRWLLWRGYGGI